MPIANQSSNDATKRSVGHAAADLVQSGMLVGLGTGSTARYLIERLGQRCREGLKMTAVPTSVQTADLAKEQGIPLVSMDKVTKIDMTIDGADEIDSAKRMIKGGGGALLCEKIIAASSKEMVVIIDESKQVDQLGRFPLPVEIVRFGSRATLEKMQAKGFNGVLRKGEKGELFVTDEGHYIVDITFTSPLDDPESVDAELRNIPGVVETGFFFNLAGRVLIGRANGEVEILP